MAQPTCPGSWNFRSISPRKFNGKEWPIDDDGQAIFWRKDRFEIIGEPVPCLSLCGLSFGRVGHLLLYQSLCSRNRNFIFSFGNPKVIVYVDTFLFYEIVFCNIHMYVLWLVTLCAFYQECRNSMQTRVGPQYEQDGPLLLLCNTTIQTSSLFP